MMAANRWFFGVVLAVLGVLAVSSVASADISPARRNFSPPCYSAQKPIMVVIQVSPPAGTLYWALEDRLPTGWVVDVASIEPAGGHYDQQNNKVKWILDTSVFQTVKYLVTPPQGAAGDATFAGTVSFNGVSQTIGGAMTVHEAGVVMTAGSNDYGQLGTGQNNWSPGPVLIDGIIAVSGGYYHNLALKSDGTVWAWGYNIHKQLSDGTSNNRSTPVQVKLADQTPMTQAVEVVGGAYHSLVRKYDGTVWTWGDNGNGQLGDGTTSDRSSPVQVKLADQTLLTQVVAIAGGGSHSLAVKSDGTVWAWGYNYYGQLGDGTTSDRSTPVQVKLADQTPLTQVVDVAGGTYHSLALKSDGTVWAWGYDYYGQLGDGTTSNRSTPVQVKLADQTPLTQVMAIGAGYGHCLALKSDGTVWAWGHNSYGQLGDGTTSNRSAPVQVKLADQTPLAQVVTFVVGYKHNMALKSDGTIWAWGENGKGQLGDGTTNRRTVPVQVYGLNQVEKIVGTRYQPIAVGVEHGLALKSDGTVFAWGDNNYGQLGNGTLGQRSSPMPVKLADQSPFSQAVAIAGGFYHSLSLKSDGTVWAWGDNSYGQLGGGTASSYTLPVQVKLADQTPLNQIVAIHGGFYHSLSLKSDGTVWAWGNNNDGQLGNGTTSNRSTPVQVKLAGQAPLTQVVDIAGGSYHSLALKSDGTVWAWGDNYYGQLGDGTQSNRSTPVQVKLADQTPLAQVVAVYAKGFHSLALKSDGTVWAWGYNASGQLGDGTTSNCSTPVQVKLADQTPLTQVAAITGGYYHNLAIKSDGTVWAWGENYYGQLGDGTHNNRFTPVQVKLTEQTPLIHMVSVAGCGAYCLAIKPDGTVLAWGDNYASQLGDGTKMWRTAPVPVYGLSQVETVAGGYSHSMFITTRSCTPVSAPSNVQAQPPVVCPSQNVQLSAIPGSGGDTIDWYTDGCGGLLVGTGTTITVPPSGNTTYFARTKNSATGCASDDCISVTVAVLLKSPTPLNVTASNGTYSDKIAVTWGCAPGATSYKVYRSTTNTACPEPPIATATTCSYDDTAAEACTTYYYSVKAVNSCGDSTCSSTAVGVRGVVLASPTDVSASGGTFCDKVAVTWTCVPGATTYKVYRSTTNTACPEPPIATATTCSYDDTTAVAGTTYYYSVKAVNACGDSSCSNVSPASRGSLPSAPVIQCTSACDKVTVSWPCVAGATSYKVYRSTTNTACPEPPIATATACSYDDTTAVAGTTYYYSAKAVNACGDSSCSNVCPASLTQACRSVSVNCAPALQGGTVTLSIVLQSQGNENAAGFSLNYDPAVLTYVSAAAGACAAGAAFNANATQASSGRIGIGLGMPIPQVLPAGTCEIATVTFSVAAGTTATSYAISFGDQPVVKEIADANANALNATWSGCTGQLCYSASTPTGLTVSKGTYLDKIRVSWDPVPYATRYEVYRSTSDTSCSGTPITTTTTNSYDDPCSTPGVRWYYSIKACNDCGCSNCSSTDSGYCGCPGYEGDVAPRPNGNGSLTISDWVQCGRFAAGLDTPNTACEFARADCAPKPCGNGSLTISDWVQCGRYAAALDALVPACGSMGSQQGSFGDLIQLGSSAETVMIATDRAIRVVGATITKGQSGWVDIQLLAQGDENALGFSLNFDPAALIYSQVKLGAGASGATLNQNDAQAGNGRLGLALAMPPGQTFAAGSRIIVSVLFSAVAGNTANASPVTFGDQPIAKEVVDAMVNVLSVSSWDDGTVILANPSPLTLTAAVSRKTHGSAGTFDIDLPLGVTASAGVECRAGGPTTVILTFSKDVMPGTGASGVGVLSDGPGTNQKTVTLSGATDQSCLVIALTGIKDLSGNALTGTNSVQIRVLLGDTNGSGTVSVADVNQTRSRSGQNADATCFRSDTNCSGTISVADVNQVRSRSGNVSTCP